MTEDAEGNSGSTKSVERNLDLTNPAPTKEVESETDLTKGIERKLDSINPAQADPAQGVESIFHSTKSTKPAPIKGVERNLDLTQTVKPDSTTIETKPATPPKKQPSPSQSQPSPSPLARIRAYTTLLVYDDIPFILATFVVNMALSLCLFFASIATVMTPGYKAFYLLCYTGATFSLCCFAYMSTDALGRLLARWLGRTLVYALFAIMMGLGLVEFCSFYMYSMLFSLTSISAILNTDAHEVLELLSARAGLLGLAFASFIICISCLLGLFCYLRARFYHALLQRLAYFYALCYVIGVIVFAMILSHDRGNILSYDVTSLDRLYSKLGYYYAYMPKGGMAKLDLNHPLTLSHKAGVRDINIVLIIGESSNRHHYSLYGYPLATTPFLDALYKAGGVIKYSDVISPAISTQSALSLVLTTASHSHDSEPPATPWYGCYNIIDIFRNAGFKTLWLSNQESESLFAPIPYAEIAHNADSYTNTLPNIKDVDIFRYTRIDSRLLPLASALAPLRPKSLLAIHVMGQHVDYKKRYESEHAHFSASDYKGDKILARVRGYSEAKRQRISEYDNALLYGDFILERLYMMLKSEDTIFVFFSDHSENVGLNADGFMGRRLARETVEIPFIIMASKPFRDKHKALMQKLEAAKDRAFMSDDLLYFLMGIADIDYKELDRAHKDPLSREYTPSKRSIGTLRYDG